MSIQRTPANPSALPVSLLSVADHLRITHNFEDEVLVAMIGSAAKEIEAFADIALTPQTISLRTYEEISGDVELPIGPVAEGAALTVQTIGTDGTLSTLTAGHWLEAGRYPVLHFTTPPNARLRITYAAGFDQVPDDLALAIREQVAQTYENRSPYHSGLGLGAVRIVARHKRVRL